MGKRIINISMTMGLVLLVIGAIVAIFWSPNNAGLYIILGGFGSLLIGMLVDMARLMSYHY